MANWKLFEWFFKNEFGMCEEVIAQNEQYCERRINEIKEEMELQRM